MIARDTQSNQAMRTGYAGIGAGSVCAVCNPFTGALESDDARLARCHDLDRSRLASGIDFGVATLAMNPVTLTIRTRRDACGEGVLAKAMTFA